MLLKQNLVRYFLLPLAKGDVTFDTVVFREAYLHIIRPQVYLELQPNVHMKSSLHRNGKEYLVINIDPVFETDLDRFRAGKYSHFSSLAKDRIFSYSSLLYNIQGVDGMAYSDSKLLALNRHEALRHELNNQLGTDLREEDELLSKPSPLWFVDFNET
jgi:hypothetical protein